MSTILLVDDDVDLAELIQTKLSSNGHDVQVSHTGEGAFELAKRVKPHIAILDVMLPGVTGYQICRRLRKDPELYRIGILVLTALGEEPEMLHGLEQGADDYLSKPFKLEALHEKITATEELLRAINTRNPITQLPGTEAIKREIDFRLARGSAIAACYVDISGFKPYCAVHGREGHGKVLTFMSQLLSATARKLGIYEYVVAHLGAEHFVVLLNLDDYERYCNTLMKDFDQQIREYHSAAEREQGYVLAKDKRGTQGRFPLMALSVGVAHTQYRRHRNANKMFEVLGQTRQMAKPQGQSVMFVDRRRAER